jgi:hypothetical protein
MLLFALTFVLALAAQGPSPSRVAVAVRLGAPPKAECEADRKAREQELDTRREIEAHSQRVLQDDVEKRYGKKEKDWPAEPRLELRLAGERVAAAAAERTVSRWDENTLDSVQDLKQALAKTQRLRLVQSSKEAQLVIEVQGRRLAPLPQRSHLLCRVTLGESVGKREREAIDWRPGLWPERTPVAGSRQLSAVHSWRKEEPWWTIYVSDARVWKALALEVVDSLDHFVKDHGQPLIEATGTKPG